MTMVGAFARVEASHAEEIRATLDRLPGVETFDLGEPGKVGLILEAEGLDAVHRKLCGDVESVEGVLKAWPVSVHLDDEDSPIRIDEKEEGHGRHTA